MAVITRRGVIHSYGVAMKIIEDTDISLTYIRKKLFSVTDTDETNAFMLFNKKKR
jgi:hypothetical protein